MSPARGTRENPSSKGYSIQSSRIKSITITQSEQTIQMNIPSIINRDVVSVMSSARGDQQSDRKFLKSDRNFVNSEVSSRSSVQSGKKKKKKKKKF